MVVSGAMRSAGSALLLSATLALVPGCPEPVTQLSVIVRSDLDPADLADLDVEVRPGEPFAAEPTATHTFVIGATEGEVTLPFSFGVTPRGGDPAAHVELRFTAHGSGGGETLVRTLRTGFVRGRTLAVPVFLSRLCRDRPPCTPPLTCGDDGTCVSADVPVESLRPVDPGHELEDAGPGPDAGGVAGLPPPAMREVQTLTTSVTAPTFVAPTPDADEVVVGVWAPGGGAAGGVLGAAGTDQQGSVVVRAGRGGTVRWTRAFVAPGTSTGRVAQGVLAAGSVFVCGEIEGTMTPEGGTALVAPDDGTAGDRDDAAFVARLDAATGAIDWAALVTAGPNVACVDLAASGSTLAVGLSLLQPGTVLAVDGAPVTLTGCGDPTAVVLRLDVSGATPTPLGGFGFANSAQAVLGLEPDDAGGVFAVTSLFASADQVTGGSCFSGPTAAIGLVHLDASGTRTWGAVPIELVGFAGLGADVARLDATSLRVVGQMREATELVTIRAGGADVSPGSMDARAFTVIVSAADGSVIGAPARIARGGLVTAHVEGRAPDTLVCGYGPDEMFPDPSIDVFGTSVPRDAALRVGVVSALDASGQARWVETVASPSDGFVTACAPTSDGGAWIGATLYAAGTVAGQAAPVGGYLARLVP